MRNQLIKLSKPRPLLPIIPICFTMLADFEKTNVPLYNRFNTNEIIGNKDDFKINVCHIEEVKFCMKIYWQISIKFKFLMSIFKAIALLDSNNFDIINKFSTFREESSIALIRRTLRKSLQTSNEPKNVINFEENENPDKGF